MRVCKLLRGDETPEHLAWALAHEWPSAAVTSNEAGVILGAHGFREDSIMRNLALLNLLWDGGTHRVGRRTSESFTVRATRLTVALQIQDATLRMFFNHSKGLERGIGFLARFLVAWPESTQGQRRFSDPPSHWPALAKFNRRIAEILQNPVPINDDGALSPAMLSLSPEAKDAWVEFHDAIEGELRAGGELYDVRDVASKTADNVARVAALFHVFCAATPAISATEGANCSRSSNCSSSSISAEHLESASRSVAWHLNESRRFFGELALPAELANAVRLDSWLVEYCRKEHTNIVSTRQVQQFGPAALRERAVLEGTIRELEELNRVRLVRESNRKDIHVNPALLV